MIEFPLHPKPMNPQMAKLMRQIEKAKFPPFWTLSAAEAKAQYHRQIGVFERPALNQLPALPLQVKCKGFATVSVVIYRSSNWSPAAPTIIFSHGGGYVLGSVAGYNRLCRNIANGVDGQVIAIDYKKAPEYPFPYAPEEVFHLWQAVLSYPEHFGVNPMRVFGMGDSAGGTLTIQAVHRCRNLGFSITGCVLIYPGIAGYPHSLSAQAYSSGFLLDAPLIDWMFNLYLKDAIVAPDWRFAPEQALSYENFPSTYVQLAECDPLVDEGVEFVQRLQRETGKVSATIYPGVVHGFYQFDRVIPDAIAAQNDTIQWICAKN